MFTGHELEQQGNLGLYHAQARMYDPRIGRFMSVDPLASDMPGWNPYHYTFNNPVRFTDPTGKFPVCENCDDTYAQGAIVSNQYGTFEYQGNDTWLDTNNGVTFGAEVGEQFAERISEGSMDFNIYPNQSEIIQFRNLIPVVSGGIGVRGGFTTTGGYTVTTGQGSSTLTISAAIHSTISNIDVSGRISVNNSGTNLTRGYSEVYSSNSLPVGSASIGLPRSGAVNVQLSTGYSGRNNTRGVTNTSINPLNINYYRVRVP